MRRTGSPSSSPPSAVPPPAAPPRTGCHLAALLLLSLALAASPAAAQVEVDAVSVAPETPTWQDRLTATVTGTSPCLVSASTSAEPVRRLVVVLEVLCPPGVPGETHPFSVEATFDRMEPGDHRLRVENGGALLAEREVTVLGVQSGWIVPADPTPTDDEPLVLLAGGLADCPDYLTDEKLQVQQAADGMVRITFASYCPFAPKPPEPFRLPVEVGPLPAGEWEVVFSVVPSLGEAPVRTTVRIHDAERCVPNAYTLCLGDGRFRVESSWRDFEGGRGRGRAAVLEDRDDTGAFWFFRDDNLELTVKVLDGCGVNGHHWVFLSPGSTTRWEVTVTDLLAPGQPQRTYGNALGALPRLVADTTAFATCP